MTPKTKNIAFWVMIIFIFALGIYLIWYINTESYKCMSQPYSYPLKLLEKANNAKIDCNCIIESSKGLSFIWNSSGLYSPQIESYTNYPVFNASEYNITA